MTTPSMDVSYVAHLARLDLSDEEIATFETQLASILDYMAQLDAIDVSGVEPTAHANPVSDVLRADEPHEPLDRDLVLGNAPKATSDQFVITKVVE